MILQDRSVGLEALQPDLRREQIFAFFAHATSEEELRTYLDSHQPDAIVLVKNFFPMDLPKLRHTLADRGLEVPIIVIAQPNGLGDAMAHLRGGAADFILSTELHRLPSALFKLFRYRSNGQEKHQASSPRIEELMDVVTEIDISGTILYESPSIKPILGYDQEELLGRNAFTLVHPLDLPRIMPIFMVALATPGVPHSARFRFKHKNGKWCMLETVGKTIVTEGGGRRIVLTSRDISERERTIALGNSETKFMSVVEGLGEGIVIADMNDKIFYANRRMGELLGRDVSGLLGKVAFKELLKETDWPEYLRDKETWLAGESVVEEFSLRREDGSLLQCQVSISPYRSAEGAIAGMLGAFTDVTSIRQAEAELQRAFQGLRDAKEKAEEMSRLKTAFLANISHEIRTPMTAMLGFSQILVERLTDTDLGGFADSIHNSGLRLLNTLNGILEFAKVESNKLEIQLTRVNVAKEIESVCALHQKALQAKGLTLELSLDRQLYAMADAYYFTRILGHLVENAVKFTDRGFIRVAMELSSNGEVAISVQDTGTGISPEFLPHVFDEFQQESSGLARAHEGAGVGLTISKRVAELMGGSLTVSSELGKGSTFTLRLPASLSD